MRLRSQLYNRDILQSWFGLGGIQETLEGEGKAGTEAVAGRLMPGENSLLNTGLISTSQATVKFHLSSWWGSLGHTLAFEGNFKCF